MKRKHMVRGERVSIQELDDVVALEPQSLASTISKKHEPPLTFEKAGLLFVKPTDDLERALRSGTSVPGIEAIQRAFQNPKGRIFLGTNRLAVRIAPSLTEDQARAANIRRSRTARARVATIRACAALPYALAFAQLGTCPLHPQNRLSKNRVACCTCHGIEGSTSRST
jgi:hypothetical protein